MHNRTDAMNSVRTNHRGIKEVPLKFLVIGDFGVGKTAIVRRYVKGNFTPHYKITIGADFTPKSMLWDSKTRINLQLWDIAGHGKFSPMTRVYYKNAVAAVVVLDLTRSSTFTSVRKWLKDLRENVTLPDGSPVPVVLMANKCEVAGNKPSTDAIKRICKEFQIDSWFSTSAKNNLNIDEAFNVLIRRSLQLKVHELTSSTTKGITLNKPIFDKKIYENRQNCC